MGTITRSFSIGVTGVTTYVIFRWRKVSDPSVEVNRRVFGPAPAVSNNFSITDLDAITYNFDTYISSDGTALTTLYSTYTMDVKNNQIVNERRFYQIGSGVGSAPDGGQSLVDTYLADKTVTGVFQRNFGYLIETAEWVRTAGGVDLVGALSFNVDDLYMVEISYKQDIPGGSTGSTNLFEGIKVITANITLDNTYIKKRTKLNGAGNQLVVTMDLIGNIPDGSQFYFVDQEDGAQFQGKIVSSDASFKWLGNTTSEIWVGKGEFLWLEKQGSNFEVIQSHAGLAMVYEMFSCTDLARLNALAEDGALYTGADYPRLWWWLNNKLNPNLVISDSGLAGGGYTRPANKQGQFIIGVTQFRMPDTRNLTFKGLSRFDLAGWNLDASRAYDYPGGYQEQALLLHDHVMHGKGTINGAAGNLFLSRSNAGASAHRYNAGGGADPFGGTTTPDTGMRTGDAGGSDNIVKNIGVIHYRRI